MPSTKSKIYSLKDLINSLKNKDTNNSYSEILENIQFGFKDVEHLCFWDRDNYSKIRIEEDEHFELVIICWEIGQQSPIHACKVDETWMYIVKGELTEEIYSEDIENPILGNTIVLSRKNISSIKKESNTVHRLTNSYNGRSVSLRLYKK